MSGQFLCQIMIRNFLYNLGTILQSTGFENAQLRSTRKSKKYSPPLMSGQFLCQTMIRNKFLTIRSFLYNVGTILLSTSFENAHSRKV